MCNNDQDIIIHGKWFRQYYGTNSRGTMSWEEAEIFARTGERVSCSGPTPERRKKQP